MRFVYWVIDGKLAGRPGPTHSRWNPTSLFAGGIRTVVSLAPEVDVGDLSAYGLIHHHADFPPLVLTSQGLQRAFIYQALPVWDFIDKQVSSGSPTLVHCYAGNDRTGVILAGYLIIYLGLDPEQAIQRLRNANPMALSVPGYEDTVRILKAGQLPDPTKLL